jgi:hypothetical protein
VRHESRIRLGNSDELKTHQKALAENGEALVVELRGAPLLARPA